MSFLVRFVDEFEMFWEVRLQEDQSTLNSLEEYIQEWVTEGGAARACGGDFQLFIVFVGFLFARWHDQRAACTNEKDWHSWIPWSVTRALKDEGMPGEIFNPLYFQYWASAFGPYEK